MICTPQNTGVKTQVIISVLVTAPMWVLLEKKAVHILDINAKYLQLAAFLGDVTSNVTEFDLCIVLGALGLVVARQFKDLLSGGENPDLGDSAPALTKTQSVPVHSKFSESVFG